MTLRRTGDVRRHGERVGTIETASRNKQKTKPRRFKIKIHSAEKKKRVPEQEPTEAI